MEFPVTASFADFSKTYFVDLLIAGAIPYELKAVRALGDYHRRQVIDYLLLLGLNHGKIFNMHPVRVEHMFASTRLRPQKRREFVLDDSRWDESSSEGSLLRDVICALVEEWGMFLSASLYTEATDWLRGTPTAPFSEVDIIAGDRVIGRQRERLLTPTSAFRITAVSKHVSEYETHLRRFLGHTRLHTLHWINLNHHRLELTTLDR